MAFLRGTISDDSQAVIRGHSLQRTLPQSGHLNVWYILWAMYNTLIVISFLGLS